MFWRQINKNNPVINLKNRAETFVWECIESRIMEGDMEKSVLDITDRLRHKKHILTTSDVRDDEGTFVVKLHAQKVDSHFLILNYL